MNSSERAPLSAVAGLTRTASVPAPPPRRVQRVPRRADETGGGEVADLVPSEPTRTHRKSSVPTPRREDATAQTMRPVTLSLPASLVAQVKAKARAERITQPEVLLDALTAAGERLTALVSVAAVPPVSDGLFLRRPARRDLPEQAMGTLSMRLLAPNVAAIDALVDKHDAPSRSALCAAALRDYLASESS